MVQPHLIMQLHERQLIIYSYEMLIYSSIIFHIVFQIWNKFSI